MDHLRGFHARQTLVETLELVGEALVIDPQQVQDRGVEIVDVDGVGGDVVREFIRLAVDRARF